jgi:hypothetical protein
VREGIMAFQQLNGSRLWIDTSESLVRSRVFIKGFRQFEVRNPVGDAMETGPDDGWQVSSIFLKARNQENGVRYSSKKKHLPGSCIESAEHVIRCKSLGKFEAWNPKRCVMDDPPRPFVVAHFGNKKVNISRRVLQPKTENPDYSDSTVADVNLSGGIILAFNGSDTDRVKAKRWTCHAVGVVAKNTATTELIVIDIYASDTAKDSKTKVDWTMTYIDSPRAFKSRYAAELGGAEMYKLGILLPKP